MPTYAADTSVSVDRSRNEIEATLRRYQATSFAYGWDRGSAVIAFEAHGRHVRFVLPLPDRSSRSFTHTAARGTPRTAAQAEAAWEQSCRQRWRALALVIKAKLEAVEANISTFEAEFLAHTVLPSGQTVSDWLEPQLAEAFELRAMPPLLAIGPGR
jgi:hypothetical protein